MDLNYSDLSFDIANENFWELCHSSSEEEVMNLHIAALQEDNENNEAERRRRRGSIHGRRYRNRSRHQGYQTWVSHYFCENHVHLEEVFRRRFWMHRSLFLRIVGAKEAHDSYLVQKRDSTGHLGLSSLQKCTAAIRMLAYGCGGDSCDDYLRLGGSTAIEPIRRFVQGVIDVFVEEYLRKPTVDDISRLLSISESRVFLGMLGSIDCMHCRWQNCPVAWNGMFSRGDHHGHSLVLEVVASKDLWIWHSFFGLLGSPNDINVLEHSPLFSDLREGRAPLVNFRINNHEYDMGYYLVDDIYPSWATFVKTIPCPQGEKQSSLLKLKRDLEKIWNEPSEYSKHVFILFMDLLVFGMV